MTDAVGTIGMFAELVDKTPTKRMARVDIRLPDPIVGAIEARATDLGLSTSELLRWLIIDGLERRDLV